MTNLKEIGIHKDLCGWYNEKQMQEILALIVKANKEALKVVEFFTINGGCESFTIDGDRFTILQMRKEEPFSVDISANGHILALGESKILSEAIATAVMNLNGFKGNFSANKIAEIIERMKESNLEYSNWITENEGLLDDY